MTLRRLALVPLIAPAALAAQPPAASNPLVAYMRQGIVAADTNHDGRVSRAEFVAARQPSAHTGGDPARGFAEMDTDRDGYLSASEIDTAIARRLAKPVQAKPAR